VNQGGPRSSHCGKRLVEIYLVTRFTNDDLCLKKCSTNRRDELQSTNECEGIGKVNKQMN
jgi:hypothetical protein